MKKNLLKGFAVAALAMIAGYNVYQAHSETEGMSELMLANVEAIAYGEGSVSTKFCYYKLGYGNESGWEVFCDEKTSSSTIYPCLQISHGYKSPMRDRCVSN